VTNREREPRNGDKQLLVGWLGGWLVSDGYLLKFIFCIVCGYVQRFWALLDNIYGCMMV
jgi:hypothetical protein